MSEQSENVEQEVTEYNEKNTETTPQASVGTVQQPPEDDGGPGSDGEEVYVDRSTITDVDETQAEELNNDTEQLGEPQKTENSRATDVLGTAEEVETHADLPDDAEQLQRKENVGTSTATVKVVLVPEGHVMTEAFSIGLSIQDLKHHLASELRVPSEVLHISLDGKVMEDQQSLMELGVQPHSSTRMEMSSTDPATHPLRPLRPPVHDNMPDVITVRVQTGDGVFKEVVVEIEHPRQQKPFLGGYRNRLTGTDYHHAATQTLPKRRSDRGVVVFSRDTQTVEVKSQAQQCPADVSTQMMGIGCYVSCLNDRLLSPGKYITADEYHGRRMKAVILLQSFVRRWLACQEVDRLRREQDRRTAWMEAQERMRMEEREAQLRDHHQRLMNPQRREDFNLLYHNLEKWRCEEEQQINSTLQGAERKAALCSLMEQEMQLIAAIGRRRIAVQSNNYDKAVKNFLDKSAAPHRWRAANGHLIEMDNQNTIRARELRDLYNNISLSTMNKEQRLHVLMTLRHTVMEHECPLTRDIVDLIDREVDLMPRVKAASLEGLRKRISTLLLQYIKTPAFNPEVAKLLKVPQDPSKLKNKLFLCRHCHRYLHSDNFKLLASGRLSSQCHSCTELQNTAGSRDEFFCYKNILRRLRADELRLNDEAKIPFLLQVEDMRYLVEVVWASRSALSGSSDLYNLVFLRWDSQRDWSPWNCILLSKEEASAHMAMKDVQEEYDIAFIYWIEHNHRLAQRHFSQFFVMAEYLDSQPVTMATGKLTTDTSPSSH